MGYYVYNPFTKKHDFTAGGKVVQAKYYQFGTVATGTTRIPYDNTIPQKTEGDEYMSLSITPSSTNNYFYITAVANMGHSAANEIMTEALFINEDSNAISAAWHIHAEATYGAGVILRHVRQVSVVSNTTFKIRCGCANVGTTTINGDSGTGVFGGTLSSNITIYEIAP